MIPNTVTWVQSQGNGVATAFGFGNKIFLATDLVVSLINNATGEVTTQILNTNYYINASNVDVDTGTIVNFYVAPPPGYTVDIRSVMPDTQLTSIKNQGTFLPELHEEALDKLTREVQDLYRLVYTFGIHGPDTESIPWPALPGPSARVNLSLGFGPTGQLALGAPISGGTITQAAFNALLAASPGQPQGNASATFQSGYLQYMGTNGALTANINFEVGTLLPNPTGTPGPCLLLGSGGGAGTPAVACIITDQAYDNVTPGNTLIITAGETQAAGVAPGGLLWLIGGASFGGKGGQLIIQGGTSANAAGGDLYLQGGNASGAGAAAIPGNVYIVGGENGVQGASIHFIATMIAGVSGFHRFRQNSTIAMDFIYSTAVPGNFGMYLYNGGGYGLAGQPLVTGGPSGTVAWASNGFTGTVSPVHSITVYAGIVTAVS